MLFISGAKIYKIQSFFISNKEHCSGSMSCC